jgi:hypothetical protein
MFYLILQKKKKVVRSEREHTRFVSCYELHTLVVVVVVVVVDVVVATVSERECF